ncbi:MAG: Ig-like domain-containing protein [Chloroflexi bacterium]|nr:Ig-like domain-containing protein [Chloroflexota bacterium]
MPRHQFVKAITCILLVAGTLAGCVPKPQPTPIPLPPTAPVVLHTQPERGQEHGLTDPIVITFDQPMDQAATEAAFTIEPKVEGTFSWDGTNLRFTPSVPLQRGATYTVTIAESARSAKGMALALPVELRFKTVGYLEVASVQPAPDTTDIATDVTIAVIFNRPVVPLSAISEQAGLPSPLSISPEVQGKGEWLNTAAYIFRPEVELLPATTYTVTVPAGLKDTTGGVLAEDYVWSFTTVYPVVVRTTPSDGDIYVGPSQVISVTFNQPMNHRSAEEHFSLQAAEGGLPQIQGTFTWDGNTMAFTPGTPLRMGTRYRGRVAAGALAATGNAGTQQVYEWTFTTAELPRIITTYPKNGTKDAEPYTNLEVTFSSPMDRDTLLDNLTIFPTATQVYSYWWDSDTQLSLSFGAQPSTSYTISIGKGMKGRYGHNLDKDYTIRFTTRELYPSAYLMGPDRIGTFNAYTTTVVYASYVNVTELNLSLYRLNRATFVALTGQDWWERWDTFKPYSGNLVRQWTEEVEAPLNVTALAPITLTGANGEALEPGFYYLELRWPSRETEVSRQLLVISRANVTLKATQTEALVWVTDLKTGQPIANTDVTVLGPTGDMLSSGRTDGEGIFSTSIPKTDPWATIFAFAGGEEDLGVALSDWSNGISPWDFDLNSEPYQEPYTVYFYTDRPIYRPGQTVYFKAVVRADDDARYSLPDLKELRVTITDGQGKTLYDQSLPLNDMGTLNGELALSEDASLGYYYINAQIGEQYFGTGFQVAEYRKPEFEVQVSTDKDNYIQGDTIHATVEASYYFGGPVAEAQVHWRLMRETFFFSYPGKGWWDFTDYEYFEPRRYTAFGEFVSEGYGKLDSAGRLTFSIPADIADRKNSQVFTIEAEVTDVNNQSVSGRTAAVVHKGLYYIGLQPESYVSRVGKEAAVKIITVDAEGITVTNKALTVVFMEHRWYSVQERGDDGRFYWTSKVEDTPVYTTTITTDAAGTARAAFIPEKGGTYKVLATGKDERGNTIQSATYLWVSSYEFVSWRRENTDRIDLIADKKEYALGDTAQILVPSSYVGPVKALLTIERGHIIEHRVLTLETNSDLLSIPIKPEHAPNIYVSVVIVKGHDASNPLASYKVGYIKLPVSTIERQVTVTITPDKSTHYSPGEKVTYSIQATDYTGKPVQAELSLHLVDLSVLALTGGETRTKIVDHFYHERGVGVRTAATLAISVDHFNERIAPEAKGGGGGERALVQGPVRRTFPDTAYWNPVVRTDAQGKAQVTVELPDNLTTWRLGSVAVTADTKVGEATLDIVSTKDLLIRPVAPRFFVIGDQAQLGAVIHNNTNSDVTVDVSLSAEGLSVDGGSQQVQIPALGKTAVNWQVSVKPTDKAVLLWSAKAGHLTDAVEITLPVYHFSSPEVVATAGQVESGETRLEVVSLPPRYDPTMGELTVQVDPSLAASMRDGLKYLEQYPYDCIEQTVSRFLPNVATYMAVKQLGLDRPDLAARTAQYVGVGLQRIYALQHYDGGWGWWLTDRSNPYISSYVLFGLVQAKKAGFAVDEEVIRRAIGYLQGALKDQQDVLAYHNYDSRAYILYVLAEAGSLQGGLIGSLYEKRDSLGYYGKAYLAMAIQLLDKTDSRTQTLVSDLTNGAILSATGAHWEEATTDYRTMNTNTRSTAIVLQALVRLVPDNALIPNVVRWLMMARKEGHWESTQETATAILALTEFMVSTGELKADYNYRVRVNGKELGRDTVTAANVDETRKLQVAVADLLADQANRLEIERPIPAAGQTGAGRLYYSAYLRYYLPVEEVKALNRGIIVSRQYALLDDPKQPIESAAVGDVIQVKLTLIAPQDLHYLVLEDPLPAGCEALDTSLKTTSAAYEAPELQSVDRWRYWWWFWNHSELRDEKVALFATYLPKGTYEYTYLMRASVSGQFLVMPTYAYEMYFPEVFGRGDGLKFTIAR